jgi:hypothetical protein
MMRLRGVWHGCGGDEGDMILRFVSYMRRPMRMEVPGGSTPVRENYPERYSKYPIHTRVSKDCGEAKVGFQ